MVKLNQTEEGGDAKGKDKVHSNAHHPQGSFEYLLNRPLSQQRITAVKCLLCFFIISMVIMSTVYVAQLHNMKEMVRMRELYDGRDIEMKMEDTVNRMLMQLAEVADNVEEELRILNHFSDLEFRIPLHTFNLINFFVIGNKAFVPCTPMFCGNPDESLSKVIRDADTSCDKVQQQAWKASRNSEVPSSLKGYIFAVELTNRDSQETTCRLLTKFIGRLRIYYDLESQTSKNVEGTSSKDIEQTTSQNPTTTETTVKTILENFRRSLNWSDLEFGKPIYEKTVSADGVINSRISGVQFTLSGIVPKDPEKVRK